MFSTSHLHPMLVHFPISLIIAGFAADAVYLFKKYEWLSKAGFSLMILGTFGAMIAYLTGLLFTGKPTEGEVVEIFKLHALGGFITLIIMSVVSVLRIYFYLKHNEDRFNWGIFLLFLLGAIAVSFTGYMGGIMVYTYFLEV